jgi:type IV secretory pathway VirB10-like protein
MFVFVILFAILAVGGAQFVPVATAASEASEAAPIPKAEETPASEGTPAPEAEETPSPEETPAPEAEDTPSPEETPAPEAEETPAPEEALPTEDPVESPRVFLKEEIDAMNPNRKIRFYASWGNKAAPEMGDQIILHAQLSGYDGLEYTIRWQFKKSAQDAWQDMSVQGETCTITLTQENLDWLFRVAVDITGVE